MFHDICLHITWHTKGQLPILKGEVEGTVQEFIRHRCMHTKGVYLHGIGGTENHVHVALSIEPFVKVSNLIGDLKGASSRGINKQKGFKALHWQRGFGVASFGRKNLASVLEYIASQKEHHVKGTVHERLEQRVGGIRLGRRTGRRTKALVNMAEARV